MASTSLSKTPDESPKKKIDLTQNNGDSSTKPKVFSSASKNSSIRIPGAPNEGEDNQQLQDLESSLMALEKLDRSSPDLWPDHIPGVSQFIPHETPQDSPSVNQLSVLQGLSQEDLSTIYQLGNLPVATLLNEVKKLHDIAYELGIEERKEMIRGKYLNIFKKRN